MWSILTTTHLCLLLPILPVPALELSLPAPATLPTLPLLLSSLALLLRSALAAMLLVLVLLLPSSCKQLKMLVEEPILLDVHWMVFLFEDVLVEDPTSLDVYWMSFSFSRLSFWISPAWRIPLTTLCPFRDDTFAFNERHDHVLRRRPPVTAALGGYLMIWTDSSLILI